MFKAGQNYSLSFREGMLSLATKRPEMPHADHKAWKFKLREADLQNLQVHQKCHMPTRPSKQKVRENEKLPYALAAVKWLEDAGE